MAAKRFKFNDYTVDDSSTDVEIQGIPFKIKRKLTLGERQKASDASVKISFDQKGQAKLDGVDQSALLIKTALLALVEWPFEEEDGTPTPIDHEHVAKLDPDLLTEIFNQAMNITKRPDLAPFAKASGGQ